MLPVSHHLIQICLSQAQLSEKLEEARKFQSDVEGFKQDQCRVVQEYESMKKKYKYVKDLFTN